MYDKTVTVFNFYSSKTAGLSYWYPHILSCVDLITDHGAMLKKYGPDSTDNAALHIAYTPNGEKVMAQQSDGSFVLLATERNLLALNRASAEELQDHQCDILN